MSFNMKEQISKGNLGRMTLVSLAPYFFKFRDVAKNYELSHAVTGELIDVKTEFRTIADTPNFFMERFSDDINFKFGGPWRTMQENIPIFVSYFVQDNVVFWFNDVPSLVAKLEEITVGRRLLKIAQDHGQYKTLGYTVKRELLDHLYEEIYIGARESTIKRKRAGIVTNL